MFNRISSSIFSAALEEGKLELDWLLATSQLYMCNMETQMQKQGILG